MQTPRAQRTSTDQQVWEFSHHKFLRGRPDLLDEIKRKALEPDPSIKHRVELPGEVSSGGYCLRALTSPLDALRLLARVLETSAVPAVRATCYPHHLRAMCLVPAASSLGILDADQCESRLLRS